MIFLLMFFILLIVLNCSFQDNLEMNNAIGSITEPMINSPVLIDDDFENIFNTYHSSTTDTMSPIVDNSLINFQFEKHRHDMAVITLWNKSNLITPITKPSEVPEAVPSKNLPNKNDIYWVNFNFFITYFFIKFLYFFIENNTQRYYDRTSCTYKYY